MEVAIMNLIDIGKFIMKLRKENGLTQEQLGEKIGVTNKTISRWETGTYLPPAEMLLALSELFNVSINEILSGKRLSVEEYKDNAEKNLAQAIKQSSFTMKEKIDFFKKKWLREHITIMVLIAVCILATLVIGFILQETLLGYIISVLLFIIAHCWRNNTMMAYIEKRVYDGKAEHNSVCDKKV